MFLMQDEYLRSFEYFDTLGFDIEMYEYADIDVFLEANFPRYR